MTANYIMPPEHSYYRQPRNLVIENAKVAGLAWSDSLQIDGEREFAALSRRTINVKYQSRREAY
jgi:hypothetical protein